MEINIKKGYIHDEEEFYKAVEVKDKVGKLVLVKNYITSDHFGKILENNFMKSLKYINL
jgi:hypothetical protein